MASPRTIVGSFAAPSEQELERDELIANRSLTLADIAQQLLGQDGGVALIRAAIICWERDHGRPAALEFARTALLGVHEQLSGGHQHHN